MVGHDIGDNKGAQAMDRRGHGTYHARSTAGVIYGVAPDALTRAVTTLSDQGSGSRSWQVMAFHWVTVSAQLRSAWYRARRSEWT